MLHQQQSGVASSCQKDFPKIPSQALITKQDQTLRHQLVAPPSTNETALYSVDLKDLHDVASLAHGVRTATTKQDRTLKQPGTTKARVLKRFEVGHMTFTLADLKFMVT